jgi:membrane protease YdiL (CAAX protease family)
MLIVAVMVAGGVAFLLAWRLVALGLVSVWAAMGTVSTGAGLAALSTGHVSLSPKLDWPRAVAAGIGTGVALYLATVAFVVIVRRWHVFDRHVSEIYDQRKGLSLPIALLLAAGITAAGEEFFWRGLVQWRLASALGWTPAALVTWSGYVIANAASGSLPILAGGIVSGAVWGSLALWTHGVLASLLCHAVWTALMVTIPPGGSSRRTNRAPAARGEA